jgi:hypothetical protein
MVFFLKSSPAQNSYNLRNFVIVKIFVPNTNEFRSSFRLPTKRRPATSH